MAIDQIVTKLQGKYPRLERVADAVFRGVDLYDGRPFAVRYFDLSDNLLSAAEQLHEYQDRLLGRSYFDTESKADLRWNHYLYFVISTLGDDTAFLRAKGTVESDREYARKIVVTEAELDGVLDDHHFGVESAEGLPLDALSVWADTLETHSLGFIVDETLQVPTVVRHITDGDRRPLVRPPTTPHLDPAEEAVSSDRLANIEIRGFREYPIQKTFEFGAVNLILGVNGVGKTSLLEAIEYLFCGKTQRMGPVAPSTAVSGLLAESELTLVTRRATPQQKLRSRHLVWYGKSELKTLTLQNSFSKFNFLDTDAAVRLSVETSSERIIDDLAQLLVGAEASKALDRFRRVARQLADGRKAIENDIAIRDTRRFEAAARLQSLRDAPQESDSLFGELLVGLRNAGWRDIPSDKLEADRLSAPLQSALISIATLGADAGTTPADFAELDASVDALADTERRIGDLSKNEIARRRDSARARQGLGQLTKRVESIDALAPIVGAGINDLERRRQSLERELSERTSFLAEAEAAVGGLPSEQTIRGGMLSEASAEWTRAVGGADERLDAAKRALAEFEATQNHLSSLRQRLRSSAQEIVLETGDTTHCPLCQAEYSAADLDKRFQEVVQGFETGESDRLRSELQAAETLHQRRISELSALQALERFVDADTATSLEAAIRLVSEARERVGAMVSELDGLRDALRVQGEKGWTVERLFELASTAEIAESKISPDDIEDARALIHDEQMRLMDTVNRLEADAQEAKTQTAEIGSLYGLSDPTITELAGVVSERKTAAEARRRAIAGLRNELDIGGVSSTLELDTRLREAQDLALRLRTAVAQEQHDSEAIERESNLVRDAVDEIEGLRVKLRRVDSAESVLRELMSKQSERDLAETVLRENAASIASTFAKIHAPNEFNLETNGGLTIVRRGGGNVEMNEMSSGQRAAYALSLFLAMNERLRSGPRVLMLDDPVAHVDDINTLSLLDHLRDIALSGERQIFFATADAKIGGLFGRKFRFLGDRFVQIELTRDPPPARPRGDGVA